MSSGKLSKTARASLGQRGLAGGGMMCPKCSAPMVATKIVRSHLGPGGMYWVCQKDDIRIRTH